ncbi:hypothetical protein TURU_021784 [Turdus rufiventris]|nr:hypothetical protein TURU_021784 [Turdus rufiventris]
MNYQQQLANSAAIRAEIQRFESVHPNIYSIYELLERVEEPVLQNQIREHVIAIEGEIIALIGKYAIPDIDSGSSVGIHGGFCVLDAVAKLLQEQFHMELRELKPSVVAAGPEA